MEVDAVLSADPEAPAGATANRSGVRRSPRGLPHRQSGSVNFAPFACATAATGYPRTMANRYLRIYLNDQYAAGLLWREIARRAQRSNAGSDLGAALDRVATAIAEDVSTFERIMDRVGVRRNPLKAALAIGGERAGRLKLNGHLRAYSQLSRFSELDILAYGIEGKKVLWQNLRDCARLGDRMTDIDFDALIARAQAQRDELEPFRLAAGSAALGGGPEGEATDLRRGSGGLRGRLLAERTTH